MNTDPQSIAHWLSRLVQIPSVSPDQAGPRAGEPGEGRLAAALAQWFAGLGGAVTCEEVAPGRPNVYATWRGQTDRWIAVDVHMDTVGVEQMKGDPFNGRIENDRVHGRGSVDTKATLAVILTMLEALRRDGGTLRPNLLVAASIDEEVGARGAPAFAEWVRKQQLPIDQLIVAEPTMCGPVYGHKGLSRLTLEVHGKSAHSSQPELGQNAITAAARVALALDDEAQRLLTVPPASALGPARLTVSLIQGGRGINVVPDSCRLSLDRRVVAGENPREVSAALTDIARRSSPLPVSATMLTEIDAFLQAPDTPWVRQLAQLSGRVPDIAPYCTNAWADAKVARECVVLGPGSIDQAHSDEEWVEIDELAKLARLYAAWWELA
jgi:acetylornithine deacetylase/succinyl-diaminopimelate desuccinylase-like protein